MLELEITISRNYLFTDIHLPQLYCILELDGFKVSFMKQKRLQHWVTLSKQEKMVSHILQHCCSTIREI